MRSHGGVARLDMGGSVTDVITQRCSESVVCAGRDLEVPVTGVRSYELAPPVQCLRVMSATMARNYYLQFSTEWERMVLDPLFTAYGGFRGIARDYHKRDYIRRRFAEIKRGL